MNRKEFILTTLKLGVSCGAMVSSSALDEVQADTPPSSAITPCEEKQKFAQIWVKCLMDNMDAQLDEPTCRKPMESCGRAWFEGAHGERPQVLPSAEQAAQLGTSARSSNVELASRLK